MSKFQTVILSGGAGTRLWPLSRENYPKQFIDLTGEGASLIVQTARRLQEWGTPLVVTTEKLRWPTQSLFIREALPCTVLGEPSSRNTAPAILFATWQAFRNDPETVLGVFPADHVVEDVPAFRRFVTAAIHHAESGQVVTLGIRPTYPATGYGYIELGQELNGHVPRAFRVLRFREKPHLELAKELLSTGMVSWNAGIFFFQAKVMRELFRKYMPEMFQAFENLKEDLSNLSEIYAGLKSLSFDVGIMERAKEVVCVPAEMGWSDVGSWEEVARLSKSREPIEEVDGRGNYYKSLHSIEKTVAFLGVSDVVVVDTPDSLVVVKSGHGQEMKEIVSRLKARSSPRLASHTFEDRPWGRFEVLIDTPDFKSKRISVLPGQKLSYQSHTKRAEHWIIVKGRAEVVLNDKTLQLKPGEHVHIPLGAKHRIGNIGTDTMEFIEVQTGSYFGEDDIVRYSDDYGRK